MHGGGQECYLCHTNVNNLIESKAHLQFVTEASLMPADISQIKADLYDNHCNSADLTPTAQESAHLVGGVGGDRC